MTCQQDATVYYGATPIRVECFIVPTFFWAAMLEGWLPGDHVGYGESPGEATKQLLKKLERDT